MCRVVCRVASLGLVLLVAGCGGPQRPATTTTPTGAAPTDEANSGDTAGAKGGNDAVTDQRQTTADTTSSDSESPADDMPSGPDAAGGDHESTTSDDAERHTFLATVDWDALATATPPDESPTYRSPEGSVRLLLLAPQGPLLIELVLSLDGVPFEQEWRRRVLEAFRLADADEDGHALWSELVANPRFRSGELGNLPIEDDKVERYIRLYDSDKDGEVDEEELPRLLTRNAGGARAFSLRSANFYLDTNRVESPLRRLLDVDRNGRIDAEEAASAPERLRARDADEDDILSEFEALGEPETQRPGPLEQNRSRGADAAVPLDGSLAWPRVLYSLQERYEAGGRLGADSFLGDATFFAELDSDGNGTWSPTEAASLAAREPDLRLTVRFGVADSPTRVTLDPPEFLADRLVAPIVHLHPSAVRIDLPDLLLQVFAVDGAVDGAATDSSRTQVRARGGFLPDALFHALDVDADGRLAAREVESSTTRLLALDRNGDGAIAVDEIPDSMALGVVRGDPQQDTAAFQPAVGMSRRDRSGPDWFQAMDRNGDGELTPREFLGTPRHWDRLDLNRDGYIDTGEANSASTD